MCQVLRNGLGGHEQRLRDLAVSHAGRGQLSNSPFAGGERFDAAQALAAGPRASGHKLFAGAVSERAGAAASSEVERACEQRFGFAAPTGAAKRGTEIGQRARLLQL